MGGIYVDFSVNNQLNSPALNSNTFANRPAAGQTGRLFISTDTFEIYRDNGTSWDLIGGPGSSTITGSGTATQVAYFSGAQAITGNNNLWFNPTNAHLGIGTNAPSGLLHADGGANVARIILDADNNVARILSFRTADIQRWSFRVDGNETGGNAGANLQFRRYDDAGNFIDNSLVINRATGKKTFNATQNYTTGLATGNTMGFNLNVPAGTTFSSPNNITALQASFLLNLAGNATMPSGVRSGLEGYNFVNFTGPGTLTVSQAGTGRQLSNIKAGWAFTGSAIGTITHLSGISILFPDNVGSAINVTNNYALYINDQNAGLGTVNYTNRWGIYQEGSADLNYLNGNLLIKSTVDNGNALQVTGQSNFTGNVGIGTATPTLGKVVSKDSGLQYIAEPLDTSTFGYLGIGQFTNGAFIGTYAGSNAASDILRFGTGGTERMRLDSAGNLGLGVQPSAWGSLFTALQIKNTSISAVNNIVSVIGGNSFYNGTSYAYIQNGFANQLEINNSGGFLFNIAPSGTAGNAISFTQAMTLTATGNVLIGTTTDAGQKLQVNGGIAATGLNGTTNVGDGNVSSARLDGFYLIQSANAPIVFWTNNTERARIHANGGFKLVPQSAAPTAEAGTLYYDSDDNKLKLYDGTNWVDLN